MKKQTQIISVPITSLAAIEKLLGRTLAEKQTPIVRIRVTRSESTKIRKMIKAGKK